MTFNEKLQQFKKEMFDLISTKEISFLWNIDKRIELNKTGIFSYHSFFLGSSNIWGFLQGLEDDKVYAIIPLLSKNRRADQPHIVLSQTFLITRKSNYRLITTYITNKINDTFDLYDMDVDDNLSVTFKYKEVTFD